MKTYNTKPKVRVPHLSLCMMFIVSARMAGGVERRVEG